MMKIKASNSFKRYSYSKYSEPADIAAEAADLLSIFLNDVGTYTTPEEGYWIEQDQRAAEHTMHALYDFVEEWSKKDEDYGE